MKLQPLSLETDESATGARHYLTPIGRLPSVTTVLRATRHELAPRDVVESVQDKQARARGTAVHQEIERYLLTQREPPGASSFFVSVRGFLRRMDSVALLEGAVWHESGFAGRLDCVAAVDGVLSVIDWKTARAPRAAAWVGDDHLQVAAYTAAVASRYGITIRRGFVVVALCDRPAQVFEARSLDASYQAFLRRLAAFHARHERSPQAASTSAPRT